MLNPIAKLMRLSGSSNDRETNKYPRSPLDVDNSTSRVNRPRARRASSFPMFFRPPQLLCMVLWIGGLLPGSFGAAPAQVNPQNLPTPEDASEPNNSSVDLTTSQTFTNWIQGRGSTFSSRISSTLDHPPSQGLPSDLAGPAADQNPALAPRARSPDLNPVQNPQSSVAAQTLAVRVAVPGARGNGAAAVTPTSLDYNPNLPPKETSSKNKRDSVPILFLNGNDDEDAAASTTKLKHGSDPHKGDDYCQDDEGKKYKTAPRPTPSKAYSPCWFVAPATPAPYGGTPSKTTTITDPKGTVWFCPSATPNDLAVHSEYDCGPHSSSLSVIPSIAAAWSAAQATATASPEVGEVLFALTVRYRVNAWVPGPVEPKVKDAVWAVWPLQPKESVDPCKVSGQLVDKKGSTYKDISPFDVPFPPSMPSLEDIKIGDLSLTGCQYTKHEEDGGTLKCSSDKEFKCVKAKYEGMQYRCKENTVVPKVNCRITTGNSE